MGMDTCTAATAALCAHDGRDGCDSNKRLRMTLLNCVRLLPTVAGAVVSLPGARAQNFHADGSALHFSLAPRHPRCRLYQIFFPLRNITRANSEKPDSRPVGGSKVTFSLKLCAQRGIPDVKGMHFSIPYHLRLRSKVDLSSAHRTCRISHSRHCGCAHGTRPMSTSEVTDACEWPRCGCLSTVRRAPHHVVVGQSPDR